MSEFDRLKMMDTDKIDSFAGKLSELASKSAALGQAIEESKLVKKFLNSLPRSRFIHIIASLEQVLDLNTTGFEDIIGRLKAYEERILDEENREETQSKLMFANTDQHYTSSRGRGHGRGGRGYRGRGRGRNNSQERSTNYNDQTKEQKDRSKVICYRCDKPGHFASSCPERIQKIQEAHKVETEEADIALFMHEIVVLNEEKVVPKNYESKEGEEGVWHLDNGASNHMTGIKTYFFKLDENIKGKVNFGDGSCVEIEGKGSILFQSKRDEQTLVNDVYYIPQLKSNILSLGQATEDGYDVRMRQNYLTLHDSNGRLLVKVMRSPNRLYKTNLRIGKTICLHSRIVEEEEQEEPQDGGELSRDGGELSRDGDELPQHQPREGDELPKLGVELPQIQLQLRRSDHQPLGYEEVKGSMEWTKACLEETDSINKNKTCSYVEKPIEVKGIGLKWIFKIKKNDDGSMDKHKARLVEEADILTKALTRIKCAEMRNLIGVQDMSKMKSTKLTRENVGDKLLVSQHLRWVGMDGKKKVSKGGNTKSKNEAWVLSTIMSHQPQSFPYKYMVNVSSQNHPITIQNIKKELRAYV